MNVFDKEHMNCKSDRILELNFWKLKKKETKKIGATYFTYSRTEYVICKEIFANETIDPCK